LKILFFLKINDNNEILREDYRSIAHNLIKNGNKVCAYDVRKTQLIDLNNKIVTEYIPQKWRQISFLRYFLQYSALIYFLAKTDKNEYDVFQFAYIREEYLFLPKRFLKKSKFNIAYIYGSDINNWNINKRIFQRFYLYMDQIMAGNPELLSQFQDKLRYEINEQVFKSLILPLVNFDVLNKSNISKDSAKGKLGLNSNDIVVHCGTNAAEIEQHYIIVSEIIKLLPHIQDYSIKFIFHLSYPESRYKQGLINHIKSNIAESYLILNTQYISTDEIVILRKATDIFINIRTVDQFVGSMFEYFLVGAKIITGRWLPYKYFTDLGFQYTTINNTNQLHKTLLKEIQSNIFWVDINRTHAQKEYDFEIMMKNWLDYYQMLSVNRFI